MAEKLMNVILFYNMKERTVIYQFETDAFSIVLINFSKKISPTNI